MGTKTWMLMYADETAATALRDAHQMDRDVTLRMAKALFPNDKLAPIEGGDLSYTCPPDDEVYAGSFPGGILEDIDGLPQHLGTLDFDFIRFSGYWPKNYRRTLFVFR